MIKKQSLNALAPIKKIKVYVNMYEETHAEIKDVCNGFETMLDEIGVDLRDIPFDYKLINRYGQIDQELGNIHKWYDANREIMKQIREWHSIYLDDRVRIQNMLNDMKTEIKDINNTVQNIKLQEFSRVQREQ